MSAQGSNLKPHFNLTDKPKGFNSAIQELLDVRGLAEPNEKIELIGADPFYKTPFKVGESVAAALAMIGVAANDLWELRHGERQGLSIDVAHAAASLRTVDYTRKQNAEGQYGPVPPSDMMAQMMTTTQPWPTKDGRWFLPHLNLPELTRRVLEVLQCEHTVEGVSSSVARWNGEALEQAIADARACGGLIRTPDEWLAHPQGQYLSARPVIEIRKVRDGAPKPVASTTRPLDGVRILDLTRILAGPIAGRTLAEHGADVLMVTAPHLPQVAEHVRDTSHGKRSCFLDFEVPEQAAIFRDLVETADVITDGYRPGALTKKGFGREQLFDLCPGLIHLSVSCFGSGGPFKDRAGWEQVAQAVTGICHTQGEAIGAGQPKLVYATMCDYLTGYMGALGVMLALARRAKEGGSYEVNVSLCQSGMFIQRQGYVDSFAAAPGSLTDAEVAKLYINTDTPNHGRMLTFGPVLKMSETPPRWVRPAPDFGKDQPVWISGMHK